ncbi:ketopantoate reductase family protein [Bacillus ndiopicus]|uniref:ketopantoate reductase family protein n=1 Tax=Bacillus ndiopicus TaxID=1347368 RepID=UPI0005A7F5D3|nr:2-dehydropantoate 2-reductase [Bacillus ndiopicus]
MRIYIIGAGAVGLLMASFLSEANYPVTVVTRREEHAEEIRKHGITRYNIDGQQQKFNVTSMTEQQIHIEEEAMVIVATKYDALQSLFPTLAAIRNVPLLFMQNGLLHYEQALALKHQDIAFGSAQFGAEKAGETTVYHRGIGVLKLAIGRGNDAIINIFEAASKEEFFIEWQEDAEQMLLEKALLNCFVNPLTALLQVRNGQLIHNEHAYHLLQQLYKELMQAFPQMQQKFPFQSVYNLCQRTANNISSMLADRQAGRKSEIETIVGAIIKKAQKMGADVPTLSVLYYLLLAIEESGEKM